MMTHLWLAIISPGASDTPAMSPAWDGLLDLSPHGTYGDLIGPLLPIAIVCIASLLCMAVWLLAVRAHLRSERGHAA